MKEFNMNDLLLLVVGIAGALGGLLAVVFKSKCKTIDCCCIKCVRDVDAVIAQERLALRRSPRILEKKEEEKEINLTLEPSAEEF
tara:strand:- start:5729 stop:5983 length:255 start_codon:yes stop_codon:yes gene_type:complete